MNYTQKNGKITIDIADIEAIVLKDHYLCKDTNNKLVPAAKCSGGGVLFTRRN